MSGIANHLRLCASQLLEAADMIERQAEELEYRKHLNKRLAEMVEAQSAGDKNIVEQGLGLRAGGGAASVEVAPDTAAVRYPPSARSGEAQ